MLPHTWSGNADWLREVAGDPSQAEDAHYRTAVSGIAALAEHIRDTYLADYLYGHTSMHSLVIRQSDEPYPWHIYLHISPMDSGDVEFKYIDTNVRQRQWVRIVKPEQTIARFEKFMDQLRWVQAVARLSDGHSLPA